MPPEPDAALFDGRPVTRDLAVEHGVSRRSLARLIACGDLRRVLYGVYIDASIADTPQSRAAAVALVLPDGAAVCRRTAAWLLGIDARLPDDLNSAMPVECVVERGSQPVRRPGVRGYVADLGGDVCEMTGIPCTTPLRTAVDLLRWTPPNLGLAVIDAMAAAALVDPDSLWMEANRWRKTRNIAQARRLIGLCEPATESFGESWLRLRMIDAGFPRPEVQIPIHDDDGRLVYRLDLGDRRRRLGWEYDGEEYHASTQQRAHDERRRDRLLTEFGWTVTGFTRGDVLGRSLALERAIGEQYSMLPRIARRRW